ncbi:MAG: hypothetical protein ACJAUV_002073 [Flavobacteriales bacterium]|jgi:hypothetical protein
MPPQACPAGYAARAFIQTLAVIQEKIFAYLWVSRNKERKNKIPLLIEKTQKCSNLLTIENQNGET